MREDFYVSLSFPRSSKSLPAPVPQPGSPLRQEQRHRLPVRLARAAAWIPQVCTVDQTVNGNYISKVIEFWWGSDSVLEIKRYFSEPNIFSKMIYHFIRWPEGHCCWSAPQRIF